jgi:ATP-dependent Lhr-like helicase
MTAFDLLAAPVQKWIRAQGWRELRPIQSRAIQAILGGSRDVIVAAATAGGKTEAAFLPLISQMAAAGAGGQSGFEVVYVSPLKALINDQFRRLEGLCETTDIPVHKWHGDVSSGLKHKARKTPRGVLLITPESLEALFVRNGTEIPRLFAGARAVVVDELHSFLDSERGVHLRSLASRIELAVNRSPRRIGLSATLGDMTLAAAYLRPDAPESVEVIESKGSGAELRLQLRGYMSGDGDEAQRAIEREIAAHLFEKLRDSNNLVFAGSRRTVETYADRLRTLSEERGTPLAFYPHHASLAREHREFVEDRLRKGAPPTTAICTSTLELGIDVGEMTCVAQIGAPFSVSSTRQRLGRSGRRAGKPAVLRQYVIESHLDARSDVADRLRLALMRTIATIELLLENWCEPPISGALHLSTLVHQILSVIAERGGAHAASLYRTLCERGGFRNVDRQTFVAVLRRLGATDVGFIEQAADGLLLLGAKGEKLVEHYGFYAVFMTPEEHRLVCDGRDLGSLPIDNPVAPGSLLIFSGRRWEVVEVRSAERVILVKAATGGKPPQFGGEPGTIHDHVIVRMFALYESDKVPVYLDAGAVELLKEARGHFRALEVAKRAIIRTGAATTWLATRRGTVATASLAVALQNSGFLTQTHDGFLEVRATTGAPSIEDALRAIAESRSTTIDARRVSLMFEKFHPCLDDDLRMIDALSSRLAMSVVPELARQILQGEVGAA